MRISIIQGSATGTAVYCETQSTINNRNGLATIQIGAGFSTPGSFSAINWANGTYFAKIETDPSGGTNYTLSSVSQLLSVPYALYAKKSGSTTETDPQSINPLHQVSHQPILPIGIISSMEAIILVNSSGEE
jgi:hypothetical protein